jgi:hypothetical protein
MTLASTILCFLLMMAEKNSATNDGNGGHFFKSPKTNECFDSIQKIFDGIFRQAYGLPPFINYEGCDGIQKIFDGSFRQAYGLPAFINCSVEQLCNNLAGFENFARYINQLNKKVVISAVAMQTDTA